MKYTKPKECPDDGGLFKETKTRFGIRRECVTCTVVQWCDNQGRPRGTPANVFVRRTRMRAHLVFDRLWKEGFMSRTAAYKWLAEAMQRSYVHIAQLNNIDCHDVIKHSEKKLEELLWQQSEAGLELSPAEMEGLVRIMNAPPEPNAKLIGAFKRHAGTVLATATPPKVKG